MGTDGGVTCIMVVRRSLFGVIYCAGILMTWSMHAMCIDSYNEFNIVQCCEKKKKAIKPSQTGRPNSQPPQPFITMSGATGNEQPMQPTDHVRNAPNMQHLYPGHHDPRLQPPPYHQRPFVQHYPPPLQHYMHL